MSSLKELQKMVHELSVKNGWDKQSPEQIFLLFTEEIGELASAIRGKIKLELETKESQEKNSIEPKMVDLEQELADVFGYVLDIANHFNIDLEKSFLKVYNKNLNREWK